MGKYRNVLVDSDVVRHFMVTGKLDYLSKILKPNVLFVVSNVYNELAKDDSRKAIVDKWIADGHAIKIDFPWRNEKVKIEYARLKRGHGGLRDDGETACMAMAKYCKEILASSNFNDIKDYCDENGIDYIGCIDILYIAWKNGIFSEDECNDFIDQACRINRARFPVYRIEQYVPDRELSYYIHA